MWDVTPARNNGTASQVTPSRCRCRGGSVSLQEELGAGGQAPVSVATAEGPSLSGWWRIMHRARCIAVCRPSELGSWELGSGFREQRSWRRCGVPDADR